DDLTWINRRLNTAPDSHRQRCQCQTQRQTMPVAIKMRSTGESMGKADSSRAARKVVHKAQVEPETNGRGPVMPTRPEVRLVRASTRVKRGAPAEIIALPEGYRPSESEPFMSERHKIYFRNKLVDWKEEIIRQNRETLHLLHEDSAQHA